MIDLNKAPKDKFIVVGHKFYNRVLLHSGLDSFEGAKKYAEGIANGEIAFNSVAFKSANDFDGIDVINDKGETPFSIGGAFGSFYLR